MTDFRMEYVLLERVYFVFYAGILVVVPND